MASCEGLGLSYRRVEVALTAVSVTTIYHACFVIVLRTSVAVCKLVPLMMLMGSFHSEP